jgi:hypothetical protein
MARKYPFPRIQKILNGQDSNSLAMENLGCFLASTSVSEIEEIKKEFDTHGSRLQFLAIKYLYPIREHIVQWNDDAVQPSIYAHLIESSYRRTSIKDDLFKGPCNIINYLNTCKPDVLDSLIKIMIDQAEKITLYWEYSLIYDRLFKSKSAKIAYAILDQKYNINGEHAIHIIDSATKQKNEWTPKYLEWWETISSQIQIKNLSTISTAFSNAYFENTARMLLSVYTEFNAASSRIQRVLNERDLFEINNYAQVHPKDVQKPLALYEACTIAIHARLMKYSTYSAWSQHPVLTDDLKIALEVWDLHDDPLIMLEALRSSGINRERPIFDLNEVLC